MEGTLFFAASFAIGYGCFKVYSNQQDTHCAASPRCWTQAYKASCGRRLQLWVLILLGLVAVALAARVIVSLWVRKMQTGSLWRQDYEWYGLEAAGVRRFPHLAPRNLSVECLAVNAIAPTPHAQGLRHTIDPSLQHNNNSVVVYVVNEEDLFGFLWHSLLREDEAERGEQRRSFPELGLELVLVGPERPFVKIEVKEKKKSLHYVLVVGDYNALKRVPKPTRMQALIAAQEACQKLSSGAGCGLGQTNIWFKFAELALT